jgi:hypothetical protein
MRPQIDRSALFIDRGYLLLGGDQAIRSGASNRSRRASSAFQRAPAWPSAMSERWLS